MVKIKVPPLTRYKPGFAGLSLTSSLPVARKTLLVGLMLDAPFPSRIPVSTAENNQSLQKTGLVMQESHLWVSYGLLLHQFAGANLLGHRRHFHALQVEAQIAAEFFGAWMVFLKADG